MSHRLWEEAQSLFPGGVNSPVRRSVKPYPFYVKSAKGPYIFTEDGVRLIDYVLAYGPAFLGHSHEYVLKRLVEQLERGWVYGTPSSHEVELARKILAHYGQGSSKIRFVNSGTEATMLALRLARAFTKREKILKFDGNYHGAHDYLLMDGGSAISEFGIPASEGIPECVRKTVSVAPYNDLDAVERILKAENVAGVIVEPVMGNMGVILPKPGFLAGLRELTRAYGALLIMDEVITGFRLSLGGAQEYFKVRGDITTLGKIIGGGMPIGAVVASREIADMISPSGKVFNAGTFNANPVSMVAGYASIEVLEREQPYSQLETRTKTIVEELSRLIGNGNTINNIGSMFQVFFGVTKVENASEARMARKDIYQEFHMRLLKNGVFIPPSQFESLFLSIQHTDEVVSETIDRIKKSITGVTS